MKRQTKLSAQQQEQHATEQQQSLKPPAAEFATPEEMLRFDAEHTTVPPEIEQRLKQSVDALPAPPRSWWKKLFKQ